MWISEALLLALQVTIEVVEDTPTETEVEMDLAKEGQRNNWSAEWININKKLFWPLFWEYPDQAENELGGASSQEEPEEYSYNPEDSVLSQVGGGWAQYWNKGWDPKDKYGKSTSGWTLVTSVMVDRHWLTWVDNKLLFAFVSSGPNVKTCSFIQNYSELFAHIYGRICLQPFWVNRPR